MNKQDEANFICDEINEIRYKEDNWKELPIIHTYFVHLDDLGYMYNEDNYDVVCYDEDNGEDFYVNDDYLDDDEY